MPVELTTEIQDWRTYPLPEPWHWHVAPDPTRTYTSGDEMLIGVGQHPEFLTVENYRRLEDWCNETGITLTTNSNIRVSVNIDGGALRRPNWFIVRILAQYVSQGDRNYLRSIHHFNNRFIDCHECGVTSFADEGVCRNGHRISCTNCGVRFTAGDEYFLFETGGGICNHCGGICQYEGCVTLTYSTRTYCDYHGVVEYCDHCGNERTHSVDEDSSMIFCESDQGHESNLCQSCVEFFCQRCGNMSAEEWDENSIHGRYCHRCADHMAFGDTSEEVDPGQNMTAPQLQMLTFPGRENIRLVGIEIEGGNGIGNGRTIARELYNAGLSAYDRVQSYHHGGGSFAHVEQDSSVDWEMVVGPVNMADVQAVRRMNQCVKIVKNAIVNGQVKLDLRCGTHIHVGAERVSVASAFNLHHIYTYAEDVMYRLGAAKWPLHRAIRNGSRYCLPIKKHSDWRTFAQEQGEHHNGLYFGNYFASMMSNCGCGAIRYGRWEECECQNLGKCTFEFRIFNATANVRKLHAYLALCQSLVAKASTMETVTGIESDQLFPAHPWQSVLYKDLDETARVLIKEAWAPRLNFLVNELPLADKEKKSIRYCVENSELNELGPQIIEDIFYNRFTTGTEG